MLLDLLGELRQVELCAFAGAESCAVIKVIEEMLVRIGAGGGILGQCLKDVQVALRRLGLVQVALDHRELVIAGGRIAADFYIAAEKYRGFFEFFASYTKVSHFQQGFGIIRIGLERLLEITFCGGVVSLPFSDKSHVEKTRAVARVQLQSFLKILLCFIESAEMAIGKSHECIGARRRIERDERLELVDRFFCLPGHEIAFAEGGVEVGALGSDLHARSEERYRVFEIILRHTDAGEKKD